MGPRVEAVLLDVGGTLWPNTWPVDAQAHRARVQRVAAVLASHLAYEEVEPLVSVITARVEEGRGVTCSRQPDEVAAVLAERRLPHDAVIAARVRGAMCIGLGDSITPFAGATDLLVGIRGLGLRCVIVSNTKFRDREAYRRDFELLGWSASIDGIVTSVDLGHAKPAREVFDVALRVAGCDARACAMVGDSELTDIEPARALGMRPVRVAIEQPVPASSGADVVVGSLGHVLPVLATWAGAG